MTTQKLNKQDIQIIRQHILKHLGDTVLCPQFDNLLETNPQPVLRALREYPVENKRPALIGLNAYMAVPGAIVNSDMFPVAMNLGISQGPIAAEMYAKTVRRAQRSYSFARY